MQVSGSVRSSALEVTPYQHLEANESKGSMYAYVNYVVVAAIATASLEVVERRNPGFR
jgi:hypothetical protein